ncbi:MAG: hypothetical protein KBA62_01775 [Polaromonas sp.]|jgi:hypothetical protein|nr:hypothetical protein [Polaromonas sp.]MBP6155903.1 hypothetical protein [Polaromonas sp.]MBP7115020.1 hypothetical protein [Polaromonas sp.]MBP7309047.1 hypothetical protein [Polaromonas sp.]MBP9831501.1 hypothetical protein [Polaromonas sp.]
MFLRRTFLVLISLVLAGCVTPRDFKPEDLPHLQKLVDPPAGKAVVYLLRAPHDNVRMDVYFGEKKVAHLPRSTYSILVVDPRSYLLASSPSGQSDYAPASLLTVQTGERRFLYVSARTGKVSDPIDQTIRQVGSLGGVIPLPPPIAYGASGARIWKECTELDAQGFMSISQQVPPLEPDRTN